MNEDEIFLKKILKYCLIFFFLELLIIFLRGDKISSKEEKNLKYGGNLHSKEDFEMEQIVEKEGDDC